MKVRTREAIGILYTPSENFVIFQELKKGIYYIGTLDYQELDREMDAWVYTTPKRLNVAGDHVFAKFNQPKEVYIYVEESKNETSE